MASLDPIRPSSVDSDHPLSLFSSHSASSISLVSSILSDSDDYCTCADEMDTAQLSLEESLFFDAELEEPLFSLNADADEQPSIVLICSADSSPVASPNLSPCLSPPFPLILPPTVVSALESNKRKKMGDRKVLLSGLPQRLGVEHQKDLSGHVS